MKQIFLDTSFSIALASSGDNHHIQALALRETLKRDQVQLVTTSAIVLEIGDGLARLRHRALAFSILEFLQNDQSI
jgi:predicted nucleic acid-binding protein